MAIPRTVSNFLADNGIDYDIVKHSFTMTSQESAEVAHITGERIVKAVVLKDEKGFLLAALPASHLLSIHSLGELLNRSLELADEKDLVELFPDCSIGAVPCVGAAYNVDTVVDEVLFDHPEVYFEAGNHEELVHLDAEQFKSLMFGAQRRPFSRHRA